MRSFTSDLPCADLPLIVISSKVEIEGTLPMQRVALVVVESLERDGLDYNLEKFIADRHLTLQ